MVDHILKIPRLVVFSVKCFNRHTIKLYLQNNLCLEQRRYRSRNLIPMFIVARFFQACTLY